MKQISKHKIWLETWLKVGEKIIVAEQEYLGNWHILLEPQTIANITEQQEYFTIITENGVEIAIKKSNYSRDDDCALLKKMGDQFFNRTETRTLRQSFVYAANSPSVKNILISSYFKKLESLAKSIQQPDFKQELKAQRNDVKDVVLAQMQTAISALEQILEKGQVHNE